MGSGTLLNSKDVRVSTDTQTNGGQVPALELKGLCKSFGGLQATREVTLRIMPGDRQAIIGPNGAGKTTLFNLITGIYPVTSGEVLLFGQDVTGWPSHRRTALGMARTFQVTSLFPKLTVLDNVLLAIKGLRPSKFVMWRFMSSYKDVYDKAHQSARAGELPRPQGHRSPQPVARRAAAARDRARARQRSENTSS